MITKQEVLLLLTVNGADNDILIKALNSNQVDIDVLKYINDNRPLDICKFYEKLRKSYNENRSKLYKNLMIDYTSDNIKEVISTLGSYALQVTLFKDANDTQLFFSNARLAEIYQGLHDYAKTLDIKPCLELIKYLKADIKAMELVYRD